MARKKQVPADMGESLFASPPEDTPLAERLRPATLEDYVGQDELIGPGSALRRAIDQDRLHSMVLWGPPGSGKTTLARIIAASTRATFVQLSAVLSGVKDVRAVMDEAVERRRRLGGRTVLFIDEIHRFNKAQQDAFLPFVERGDVVLVGATTENPSFGVIGPLLSRCRVHALGGLDDAALRAILARALSEDPWLEGRELEIEEAAEDLLVAWASGDARSLLTLLEVAARSLPSGEKRLTAARLRRLAGSRAFLHDKRGDQHHDLTSAFIKSLRNSDPDAALYWMSRMLAAGEDPLFILRRMLILAAEDVGLADPRALQVAVAAHQAFERLGLPEGEIPMAEACVYLATAPKSNAAHVALEEARRDVETGRAEPVPLHLRNAVTGLGRRLGHGDGYRHAHDEDEGITDMTCLPASLEGRTYYRPTRRGYEAEVESRLTRWRRVLRERRGATRPDGRGR